MYNCNACGSIFSAKRSLVRHLTIHSESKNHLCEDCGTQFARLDNLKRHAASVHAIKRSVTLLSEGRSTTTQEADEASTSKRRKVSNNLKKCEICDVDVDLNKLTAHLNSLSHKKKLPSTIVSSSESSVRLVSSAFSGRIGTYIVENSNKEELAPSSFLSTIRKTVVDLLSEELVKYSAIKFNIELFALYAKPTEEDCEFKSFNTKNKELLHSSDIEEIYDDMRDVVSAKSEEFQERDSGWSLIEILYLEININKYNPLRGATYIPLPSQIVNKHACVNVKNNDNKCFLWACLSCLHPIDSPYANRVNLYEQHANTLNFTGLEFPINIKDIPKFERMNENISVNVFGLEYNCNTNIYSVIGPYHHTEKIKANHINLLYIENQTNGHYVWIKNLSRLVSSQLSHRQNQKFICNGCLVFFRSAEKLEQHMAEDCNHLTTLLPKEDSVIKFEHAERQLKVPFVVYADFESLLKPIPPSSNLNSNTSSSSTSNINSTRSTHEHIPASFGYYIKSDFNQNLSKYVSYRGIDCSKIFLQKLKEDVTQIYHNYLKIVIPMIPLTQDELLQFENSTSCFICNKTILHTDVKVQDHCHLTGKYRGSAHNSCNLNYKIPEFIPVFFHNMSGYDLHLFIKECGNYPDDDIQIIPMNKENYVSLSIKMQMEVINYETKYITIRFLDSFRFMASSIDTLVSSMKPDQFIEMKNNFQDKYDLLIRKGVYPYEYMDSWTKFNDRELPPISSFHNKMTDEALSSDQYEWAQNVWTTFNIKDLGEYSDLYLKTDVILLADIFENFRATTMKTYKLDPCHYYTTPGLSFDAMLKMTNIEIEHLHDVEMIHFVKKGIRGGISQCSNRYGKANNKYLESGYDEEQKSNYLIYLDANNLYGWAMSQALPYGGFTWLTELEISNINFDVISQNSEVGYIFECDLTYPKELHDMHNDFPFCAENISPPNGKFPKLIPNLNNKKKYIIHIENLKQCLKHGLKLDKIHRALKFNQSPWLKKYIDLNTQLRQNATTEFEKNQYKLCNNAIYGKTMENIEKRVDVKLANHWENNRKKLGASSLIAKPNFHSRAIFTNNLIAVQLNKTKIFYNKPIYLGFCVLELSKTLMYEFHYDYIVPKYGPRAKILYTDTDSFVYDIQTKDFFDDIKFDIQDRFDTSAYPSNNRFNLPVVNKKVVGKMKDELDGRLMSEFVGLRSKLYALTIDGECDLGKKCKKRAKGINKSVIKKLIFEDYIKCLNDKVPILKSMSRFKSIKHTLFTQEVDKIALSSMDDKRYLIPNSHDTLAWGHYKINNNT